MTANVLRYFFLTGLVSAMSFLLIARQKSGRQPVLFTGSAVFLLVFYTAAALFSSAAGFGRIQLLTWGVFLILPLYLLGATRLVIRASKPAAYTLLAVVLLLALTAADAFLFEPNWLQVTRIQLKSPELDQGVKIAVLADLQTDQPGRYEARVISLAAEEHPDLILFAGDYLQYQESGAYQEGLHKLNRILREANLAPPLGMIAVRGNVDWNGWTEVFQGLPVRTVEHRENFDLGPLIVTGLSWQDSQRTDIQLQPEEKFHLVLGHSPNFSLGEIKADFLIAGHTHGGQVQLPGVGPLMTLSEVPRAWASGLTEISPGQHLLVSRGIGMERGEAPRMRFLCRPELIIVEISPVE